MFDASDAPFIIGLSLSADFVAENVFDASEAPLSVSLSLDAEFIANGTFISRPFFARITLSASEPVASAVISVHSAPLIIRLSLSAEARQVYATSAEIWGSRIGALKWALAEDNEAFRRPTLSRGSVLQIIKIGKRAVIFSDSGIDYTEPVDLYWRYEHVSDHGLLSAWAITKTDESEAWFLDSRKRLIRLNVEGFHDCGCAHWFNEPDYVLSWDATYGLIYISGRNEGFVYSPANRSLGTGLAGITGVSPDGLVVGHGDMIPGGFNICTSAYDLGSRSFKTVRSVEFSIHTSQFLEAAIDFKYRNDMDWRTTPWKRVNPSGVAYIPCYGLEFRFRLRSNTAQRVHLDQIRVIGTIHGYDFLNAIGWAPNANNGG